jgi:hypothetical protein
MVFLVHGGMVLAQRFRSSFLHKSAFITINSLRNLTNLLDQLAAKLKLNAPYAHTWLEIVYVRWGRTAHLILMFFGSVVFLHRRLTIITEISNSG